MVRTADRGPPSSTTPKRRCPLPQSLKQVPSTPSTTKTNHPVGIASVRGGGNGYQNHPHCDKPALAPACALSFRAQYTPAIGGNGALLPPLTRAPTTRPAGGTCPARTLFAAPGLDPPALGKTTNQLQNHPTPHLGGHSASADSMGAPPIF